MWRYLKAAISESRFLKSAYLLKLGEKRQRILVAHLKPFGPV